MEDFGGADAFRQRRHSRFRYLGIIYMSWAEPGGDNHVIGKCLDISEGGLGVQVARTISLGTEVRVHADWVKLEGTATVRHSRAQDGAFHIGLELKQPLPLESLAELVPVDMPEKPAADRK